MYHQVSVLLGFELLQSINWLAGTIISEILYGRSAAGVAAREDMDPKTRQGLIQACQVIGGFTYATDVFLYLWNACLVRKAMESTLFV